MESPFDYRRRRTHEVNVGNTPLGGDNPVRIQTMGSLPSMDTAGCVAQCRRMVDAGAEYVRFTAQGVREAANLGVIRDELRREGIEVPVVADIHFNPRAAFEAALHVDKVRINPGNFVDPGRVFRKIEYTDAEYAAELERVENAAGPFFDLCRSRGVAVRIGVNHGSLSDRIMSRYGDTPAGMVESAMEFLRVARRHEFTDAVISIKASNVCVMVETVRRLVDAMEREGMDFPLHLGVTEAGDGADGRVKSAVGIGTLLAEGLGDTIRVSLSEEPECELPVARALVDYITTRADAPHIEGALAPGYDRYNPLPRREAPVVAAHTDEGNYPEGRRPDLFLDSAESVRYVDADSKDALDSILPGETVVLSTRHANPSGRLLATLHEMRRRGLTNRTIVAERFEGVSADDVVIRAAADLGRILLAGFADGIMIESDAMDGTGLADLAFGILQASRTRITRTEYIACPSCGRTLFDLQTTLRRVKEATSHLKGLKIGVMGCIVNGPGEMADADYGYVGAGKGHISLYRGHECIEKNIPEEEAIEHLTALIKADGRWK